ncbi:hypothetical protein DO72_4655 [Burkholderia pseudomallei]|nr:hypothetical protein DO72_4655 [Burkholderia pseudomallei]
MRSARVLESVTVTTWAGAWARRGGRASVRGRDISRNNNYRRFFALRLTTHVP